MKREYIKLFCCIIGITLVISGVILYFVNIYKKEKSEEIAQEQEIIDTILRDYETFGNKTETFSEKRDSINEDMKEYLSYYTTMKDEYEEMIEELNNYESLAKEVEDSAIYLKEKCLGKMYSSQDANNKCNAYVTNYEKTINSFVGDIEFLNSKFVEYNEWIVTENENLSEDEQYPSLEKFVPKYYPDYIDINDDGVYLGRESD